MSRTKKERIKNRVDEWNSSRSSARFFVLRSIFSRSSRLRLEQVALAQLAFAHREDPLAVFQRVEVVRDDQQRRALGVEARELLHDAAAGLDVEIRRRLVGNHQPRAVDQRAGDQRPPQFAAGQFARVRVGRRADAEALQQQTSRAFAVAAARIEAERQHHVLQHGQIGQRRRALGDKADAVATQPRQFRVAFAGQLDAVQFDRAGCPSLTRGRYAYDFCDTGRVCPLAKMYTLGSGFIPSANHAGGLRYHGMSSTLSQLYDDGLMEARSVEQTSVFEAAEQFARIEGILPAPESSHAIRVAIDEALKCKETGEEKTIVFGLTGTGYFDMVAYEKFNNGEMTDYIPTDEELAVGFAGLPKVE